MKISFKISAAALLAAMLLSVPTTAATINIGGSGSGGLLGVGGSNTDPSVDVLTNGGLSNSPTGTATTNAPNGTGPTTTAVNLGGTGGAGGANGNVLLDLFGPSDGSNAAVALGSGNGADGGAALDLFGNGGSGNGSGGSSSGSGSNDLFGPPAGHSVAPSGIRVASLDNLRAGQCFAPDATQIARLISRHNYSDATLSNWVTASSISVIRTNLCSSAQSSIVHDANVARLQAFVRDNPKLQSFLSAQGRSARDVIALDKRGDTLTVYVS